MRRLWAIPPLLALSLPLWAAMKPQRATNRDALAEGYCASVGQAEGGRSDVDDTPADCTGPITGPLLAAPRVGLDAPLEKSGVDALPSPLAGIDAKDLGSMFDASARDRDAVSGVPVAVPGAPPKTPGTWVKQGWLVDPDTARPDEIHILQPDAQGKVVVRAFTAVTRNGILKTKVSQLTAITANRSTDSPEAVQDAIDTFRFAVAMVSGWHYKSVLGILSSSLRHLAEGSPDEGMVALWNRAAIGAVRATRDRYTVIQAAGHRAVGVALKRRSGGGAKVTYVYPGSTAEHAGLQAGDEIVRVDGKQPQDLAQTQALLGGDPSKRARVTVHRDGARIDLVCGRGYEQQPPALELRNDGIAILRLTNFHHARLPLAPLLAMRAEEQKTAVRGLVLDLRGNPGGSLDEAAFLLQDLVENGPGFSAKRRDGVARELYLPKEALLAKLPLVVLIDRGTASAAEVVVASLKESGRALILGDRTFGKARAQRQDQLPNGATLTTSTEVLLGPSGKTWQGKGIAPHISSRKVFRQFVKMQAPVSQDPLTAYAIWALGGEGADWSGASKASSH